MAGNTAAGSTSFGGPSNLLLQRGRGDPLLLGKAMGSRDQQEAVCQAAGEASTWWWRAERHPGRASSTRSITSATSRGAFPSLWSWLS